jgi:hypothetical protein
MNDLIAWIAAEADPEAGLPEIVISEIVISKIVISKIDIPKIDIPKIEATRISAQAAKTELATRGLVVHTFPVRTPATAEQPPPFAKDAKDGAPGEPITLDNDLDNDEAPAEVRDGDRERRIYRGRTVAMLRRYMRYSIETGRLPSLLGGEMFRAKVTTYTVVTFEDRVIFVHDMEKCLGRLDEFSRQLIARHILQEHDRWATAKLLHCNEKTIRRYAPLVLDLLSNILLEAGLLQRLDTGAEISRAKSCQGGKTDPFDASDCEDGKYKS